MKEVNRPYSVVIPLYNKEPHIAETIGSVLSQTYTDFELIIINDASTDRSIEIVNQFTDARIRLVHRKVPGPGGYAARNQGIIEASYDWIAFLDADDTWEPEFLSTIDQLIEDTKGVGFFSTGWHEKSKEDGIRLNSFCETNLNRGVQILDLVDFLTNSIRNKGPVCSSVAVVDKSLIKKAGLFPENKCQFGGDIDTWLRVMLEGNKLAVAPKPLATYNKEAVNMVTKKNKLQIIETCVHKTVRQLLEKNDVEHSMLLKQFVNHYQYLQIRKRGMAANLNPENLKYVYPRVSPATYLLFYSFSLLPDTIQKKVVDTYKAFK